MSNLDQIHISDLALRGIVGINESERTNPQDILINATLFADSRVAAASDAIEDTVNYRTITKAMIAHVSQGAPMLVERLAAELAAICLDLDHRVARVELTVEKPGALRFARSVGITIVRSREDPAVD